MSTPESPLKTPSSSEEALPDGWVLCESKSLPGRKYYFDRRSGSSLWTKPQSDTDKAQKRKAKKCKKSKHSDSPNKNFHSDDRKPNVKRKSDDFDKESCSHKRSRHDDDSFQSPTPSCSSGATATPKTSTSDYKRKGLEFLSPQTDYSSRETQKVHSANRSGQSKEQRADIPKNSIKNMTSPQPAEKDNSNPMAYCEGSDHNEVTWSPSQFFEANKLICSLQDNLAEEKGVEREKRKDTYAAIEEGITQQTIEYSSKNHPATPPHFREASHIVTTIKTRLNENISVCEKKPRFSTPANDRLAALRSSLNQSTRDCAKSDQSRLPEPKQVLFENKNNVHVNKSTIEHIPAAAAQRPVVCYRQKSDEAMHVEETIEKRERLGSSHTSNAASTNMHPVDHLVLVVDTNIFIHDMQFLKLVFDSYIEGYKEKPTLIVPWQVINELDRMKDNNNGNKKVCAQAKIATDYLYQILPNSNRIKGQTIRDSTNHIYPCELPDDEILNCCLQQSQRGNAVILLSNDKNLCTRATINSIQAMGVRELKEMLRAESDHTTEFDSRELLKYYESCIYQLLANVLENEMRARYNSLWQQVLFKAPPWSLLDVLQCLVKHWIAVFSEVFPRIEPLIQQLKTALTRVHDKGPRVTSQELRSFKDLAHELASKCQIIPEYMELAKITMERLNRDPRNEGNRNVESVVRAPEDEERLVIEAFETVWTAFSAYCAKLATMLGVSHQLEDRIDNIETSDSLRKKWSDYSNHIQSITYALKRTLTANENSGIEPLHTTLSECLTLIGGNYRSLDYDNLRTFCLNNRNMIHEALVKFGQLTEVLSHCGSVANK